MKIFSLSLFVKNQFENNTLLYDLLGTELDLSNDWIGFQKNNPHLDMFALSRTYRQTRMALIAAQDSLHNNPQEHIHTLKQTSTLAKLLITYAYEQAAKEMQQKCGDVLNTNDEKQSFIIFALGKLGGSELNYSSDVDLVFCYSGNGQSNGKKCIDAQAYFDRIGRRIIQLLDSITTSGIVYRVDMRLRPFGSAAPLTCSVQNLLNYLESEGRDWERYAWLRASFVAGDEDLSIDTLKQIEPFIYRKYLDYSIFESLRQIKAQIERNQIDDQENLKLGYGGIREIEFIIQTLQITFGGRNKSLRGNDLWQQMHNLCEFKHISVKDLQQLTGAWLFLRRLENLCQIIQDRDAHHLPENTDNLSLCMACNNSQELLKQLNFHRTNVHKIFEQLFLSNQDAQTEAIKHPQIERIMDDISQRNHPKLVKHKLYASLQGIVPLLPQYPNESEIIERFVQVINAVSRRPSYLSMLIESPLVVQKLVAQLSHSAFFSKTIATTPSLLELLFEEILPSDFDVDQQWQVFSDKHTIDDAESHLEILAQFKQRMHFLVVIAYVDKSHNAQVSCQILSAVAELILSKVIRLSWKETHKQIKTDIQASDLIVVAYGSLATKTMHLNSDFDLVFILAQEINDNNHKFVMRWIKRTIHFLAIQSYSGSLYQLDTQLRPNGKSGAAIVSQSNFENYQKNHAWTWEHAALIKTRAVYAKPEQKKWFKNLRKEILCQKRDAKKVKHDLEEMAQKMQRLDKSHHNEFKQLGEVLIQAYKNPEIINSIQITREKITNKLNHSIY